MDDDNTNDDNTNVGSTDVGSTGVDSTNDSSEELPRVVRRRRGSQAAQPPTDGATQPLDGVGRVPPAASTVKASRKRSRALGAVALICLLLGAAALAVAWVQGRAHPTSPQETAATTGPATPVLSARRVPAFTTAPIPLKALAAAVQPVADASPPGTCITVGDGTHSMFAHNPVTPLVPASNQKLLTGAAVLDTLGSDTTLVTDFRAPAAPIDGVIDGDLFMVGGGDPLLGTDGYRSRQTQGVPPETDLEAVADQLVADGLREVRGSVVGDGSRYDTARTVQGWPQRWLTNGTVGPLSALSVNDSWSIDPVTGQGPGGAAGDPDQQAAAVMTRLLTDRGVKVGGPPISGTTSKGTTSILEVQSLPLSVIVGEMLTFSDNTTADMLLKELGVRNGGGGTTAEGSAVVADWLASKGYDTEGWVMADGSGLSSDNRVTCNLLGAALRDQGPDGDLAAGLAVPGGNGTLTDRFESGEWPQRVRAKTGTLNNVSSLSGWLLTRKEVPLDFEIVINTGDRGVNNADLGLQAQLLTALLDQPVAAPLDAAGPLAPTP
ncbi:MAG: D-alanyl-D-alanine carboxypeptidase [Microthrixaceae bacterium]